MLVCYIVFAHGHVRLMDDGKALIMFAYSMVCFMVMIVWSCYVYCNGPRMCLVFCRINMA